jgi:hypothetical protein
VFGNQRRRNSEILPSSSTRQQAHEMHASSAIWQLWQRHVARVWESTLSQFESSPVLLKSTTSSRNGCIVCYMAASATRRSQSLGINVVAIRKFSCPPQLNNKLTKRMRRLLYGSIGNETWQRLSGTLQEQTASVQQ